MKGVGHDFCQFWNLSDFFAHGLIYNLIRSFENAQNKDVPACRLEGACCHFFHQTVITMNIKTKNLDFFDIVMTLALQVNVMQHRYQI